MDSNIASAVTSELYEKLVQGIALGEYSLLLGAGASLDAHDSTGRSLPLAGELTDDICKDFDLGCTREKGLVAAYTGAEGELTADGRSRSQYFLDRFSNCTPSWQGELQHFPWKRVWTLNIDDVVENAYGASNAPFETVSWDEKYQERTSSVDTQIVHLHGFAPRLAEEPDHLVFSIQEYLRAISQHHAWHAIFADEFSEKPFLAIGASLTEEIDLREVLNSGNASLESRGRPSLAILKSADKVDIKQIRNFGLIPVLMTGEAFFDAIRSDVVAARRRLTETISAPDVPLGKEALVFLRQFRTLSLDSADVSSVNHDFYGGDAPRWKDIVEDLDARLEVTDKAFDLVIRSINDRITSAICISGIPGSGKSTSLLRIAKLLLRNGFPVYMFRAEEYLDIDTAIWWARKRQDSIFIFDDVGDFSADIGKLLKAAEEQGLACGVLCAERSNRMQAVRLGIEDKYLHPPRETRLDLLSDKDIGAIISKLAHHRRLGRLTKSSRSEQFSFFRKTSERQLLVAMAELEGSQSFRGRIANEYSSAGLGDNHNIYATICMAHALGIPAPLGILRSATGLEVRQIQAAIDKSAGSIVEKEGRAYARHRVIASVTVEDALDANQRFAVSLALAKALSTHVTREAISQGTLYYRLARNLMRAETVKDWIGQESAGRWYEALQSHYAWNSRFWEQRARSELFSNNYPKARSYAEEAVKIHRHPFCENTLGYVLIRMATEYYGTNDSQAARTFWEAVEHLRNSRDSSFRDSEHPYLTFFSYTLRFAKEQAARGDTAFFDRMEREWSQWIVKVKLLGVFSSDNDIRKLDGFVSEWAEVIGRVRRGTSSRNV